MIRHLTENDPVPTMAVMAAYVALCLPSGLIVMWSGSLSVIPSGWNLCDGTNGTPDLRDRFIAGTSASVDPGLTGGASTHTHAAHPYTPAGTNSGGSVASTTSGVTVGNHSYTPAGTNSTPTLTMNSYTPGGSNSTPTLSMNSFTPAGTINAHTTIANISLLGLGSALSGPSTHTFTGTGATPTGTVSSPTFTGTPATLTGSVSTPTFSGTPATLTHTVTDPGHTHTSTQPSFAGMPASLGHDTVSNLPPYFKLAFLMKS